ncbi:MAG: type 1 glutamine amidotransferase-like domain-containing protein [bacterium]|nr:type 1 glutamine amidotransferase-like domain-containing protein [bacterium]
MSEANVKPVFLLADSQMLFWREKEEFFLERIRKLLKEEKPEGPFKAAYIGASNGDKAEYYDIFLAAMNQVGIGEEQCQLIRSKKTRKKDLKFLEEADLILLAGGDIEKGWEIIKEKFQQTIVDRYYKGSVLMGISAGAVQLGLRGWKEGEPPVDSLFETFQLVPAVVDVHNEQSDWNDLRKIVEHLGPFNRGFGIPAGGAAVYHPDWSFEAGRHHLVEFSYVKDEQENPEFKRSLIIPSGGDGPEVEVLPPIPAAPSPEVARIIESGAVPVNMVPPPTPPLEEPKEKPKSKPKTKPKAKPKKKKK